MVPQVFSKIFRCALFALAGLAAVFAAALMLTAPASALLPGIGNGYTTKPWDTDNLAYGSYSAENFRVPFHQYRGYATASGVSSTAREACQPGGVADAFFQTDSGRGRNDFPVLASTTSASGTTWTETATGTKNTGCAAFVDAQLTMAARARSNGGYYLDNTGNLVRTDDVSAARFLAAPVARTRTYGSWF